MVGSAGANQIFYMCEIRFLILNKASSNMKVYIIPNKGIDKANNLPDSRAPGG